MKEKEGVATGSAICRDCARRRANLMAERIAAHDCACGQARIASKAPHHHQRNLGEVALRSPRGLVAAQTRKELIHIRPARGKTFATATKAINLTHAAGSEKPRVELMMGRPTRALSEV